LDYFCKHRLLVAEGQKVVALRFNLSPQKLAACHAFTQWFGETCVGLIPLLAYLIMHSYSTSPITILSCPVSTPVVLSPCSLLPDNISQEICILTVVISGLALLSVLNVGPHKRKAPVTAWSFILIVAAILALLAGALLYALFGVHIAKNADSITWFALATAISSSLFLAIEGAILDA
jgi:hypothetical protein